MFKVNNKEHQNEVADVIPVFKLLLLTLISRLLIVFLLLTFNK